MKKCGAGGGLSSGRDVEKFKNREKSHLNTKTKQNEKFPAYIRF